MFVYFVCVCVFWVFILCEFMCVCVYLCLCVCDEMWKVSLRYAASRQTDQTCHRIPLLVHTLHIIVWSGSLSFFHPFYLFLFHFLSLSISNRVDSNNRWNIRVYSNTMRLTAAATHKHERKRMEKRGVNAIFPS